MTGSSNSHSCAVRFAAVFHRIRVDGRIRFEYAKEVLQHGGSILGSVILCGTFRRIPQLWDNAHTLNLEICLLYLSSTIPQFFDFILCMVFDFIFYYVTTHTLCRVKKLSKYSFLRGKYVKYHTFRGCCLFISGKKQL